MPSTEIKISRQQLQILMEGMDGAWIFEAQPNLPRVGEYVTIFDKDGHPLIEGRVVDIQWTYLEEDNGSTCTLILRPKVTKA
jgi:hypothetical protein